jgi:hypothetical protein
MAPRGNNDKKGKDHCRICKHDGKFREGRTHCAHCGAGKGKALGFEALGKGGRVDSQSSKPKDKKPPGVASGKDQKDQKCKGPPKSGTAASDAATVAAVYKELTALRAECAELRKKQGTPAKVPNPAGVPAARTATEDDATKAKKTRMDELRSQIEHLEKGGEGLEEILKARREELERLRQEVRAAHPLDVQVRHLDSKIAGVRKQREKHEEEAKSVALLILELKTSLDRASKAAAEKKLEEDQLAKERVELVAKQNASKLAEAEAAAGGGTAADPWPEQLRGLDDLDPGIKAGLQAYFSSKRAAAGTAQAASASPQPPGSSGGGQPKLPDDLSSAVAAAAAAAATRVGQGDDAEMQRGDENEGGEDSKRRRLAGSA